MSSAAISTKRRPGSSAASSSTTVEARRIFSTRGAIFPSIASRAATFTRCLRVGSASAANAAAGAAALATDSACASVSFAKSVDAGATSSGAETGASAVGAAVTAISGEDGSGGSAGGTSSLRLSEGSGASNGGAAFASSEPPTVAPHCGQKPARLRTAAPHDLHRRDISGSIKKGIRGRGPGVREDHFNQPPTPVPLFSYSVHGVEEVFALGVDVHAQALALFAKTLLERGGRLARA